MALFGKKKSRKSTVSRYARQMGLPEVGKEGQAKLSQSKVIVVGAGGLGCPAAIYLAAAGVGTIGIIDDDNVDITNLQRQVIYKEEDINKPKADVAKERINNFNSSIAVNVHKDRLTRDNVHNIILEYDLVLNGCDNFPSRYLLNDACCFARKPLVDGSVNRFIGQVTLFEPWEGPCYHCLYPEPPSAEEHDHPCMAGGVIGALPGVIGSIQALEAIKYILNIGESLLGRLIVYDALKQEFKEIRFQRDSNCPVCGKPQQRAI